MNDRETWIERGLGISVLAARHDDDDSSRRTVRFGSVSFLNGISTFLVYLMPKPFFLKNSSGTI